MQTIGLVEKVKIIGKKGSVTVEAVFDTGATRTSIDKKIAGKVDLGKPIKEITVKSNTDPRGYVKRILCKAVIGIKGKKIAHEVNIADRSRMAYPVLIGRNAIYGNFIIDITKTHKSHYIKDRK